MWTNSESSKSHSIYFNVGDRVKSEFYGLGSVTRKVTEEFGERIVVHFDHGADVVFSPAGEFVAHHKNPEFDLSPSDESPVMTKRDWAIVWFMAGACAASGLWGFVQ